MQHQLACKSVALDRWCFIFQLAVVTSETISNCTCEVCAEFHALLCILPFLNLYLQGQIVFIVSMHANALLSCWTSTQANHHSPTAFACQEGIIFHILAPLVRAPIQLALSLLQIFILLLLRYRVFYVRCCLNLGSDASDR